jgi:hypothetical protein
MSEFAVMHPFPDFLLASSSLESELSKAHMFVDMQYISECFMFDLPSATAVAGVTSFKCYWYVTSTPESHGSTREHTKPQLRLACRGNGDGLIVCGDSPKRQQTSAR